MSKWQLKTLLRTHIFQSRLFSSKSILTLGTTTWPKPRSRTNSCPRLRRRRPRSLETTSRPPRTSPRGNHLWWPANWRADVDRASPAPLQHLPTVALSSSRLQRYLSQPSQHHLSPASGPHPASVFQTLAPITPTYPPPHPHPFPCWIVDDKSFSFDVYDTLKDRMW